MFEIADMVNTYQTVFKNPATQKPGKLQTLALINDDMESVRDLDVIKSSVWPEPTALCASSRRRLCRIPARLELLSGVWWFVSIQAEDELPPATAWLTDAGGDTKTESLQPGSESSKLQDSTVFYIEQNQSRDKLTQNSPDQLQNRSQLLNG